MWLRIKDQLQDGGTLRCQCEPRRKNIEVAMMVDFKYGTCASYQSGHGDAGQSANLEL